jgi:multiple sugar transport system substrate-binding protein
MGLEGENVQKLIPGFTQKNPHIRVTVQMVPWTAAQEKLISAFASDNLPDVFQLGNTWVPQFVALEAIENLDPFIAGSSAVKAEHYFSGIWHTNEIQGQIYGIPWYVDTRVLFYRTDVLRRAGFSNPPLTWDELYQLSQDIKKLHNGAEKYAIYMPTNEWAPFVIFGMQAGAALLRDDDCYGNFSSPQFKKGFSFLIRFIREGLAPMGISQVTNVYQAFREKYFSMYISGPWNIKEFQKWMSGELGDQWMTAPLPGPDRDTPGVSLAGGASLVMSHKSKHKREVWRLIEYLSEPSVQLEFYQLVNSLPAVRAAWQDELFRNDPYMQAFFEQFHHLVATPKIPEWEQIAFSKIQQYAELAARGIMTEDEALQALDKDVDNILEKRRWLLGKND